MKYLTFLFFIILNSNSIAYSQDILLEETVNYDTIDPLYGRNYPHYLHLYVGYGLVAGKNNDGSKIIYGRSYNRSIGIRYKGKLNNVLAVGADLSYNFTSFALLQDTSKFLPNNIIHFKEKLTIHQFATTFYLRSNWGKRGNFIGNFIDLGGTISFPIYNAHQTKDKLITPNENGGTIVKTKTTKLDYIEPHYYSAILRVGINRFVLTGTYRITELFKLGENQLERYPELPNLIIGIEVGFHK